MAVLKIGVIGAGHLGKIHIRCIKDLPEYELIGVYDINTDTTNEVAATYQIKAFQTAEELIDAVDVVDIVAPTSFHYDLALSAIRKLKHVFIEKPVAKTVEQAENLILLANEAQVKVQVGHVERFNPAFTQVKSNYGLKPLFIEAHRLSLFNPRGTDVSIVLDLMIHDIDIVLNVMKSNIKHISASGVAVVSATPDIANVRIEFDNGGVANLTASRISLKNMRKMRFFQKDAYISVDFLDKKAEVFRLADEKPNAAATAMEIDLGNDIGQKFICFESPEVPANNAIRDELAALHKAIIQNTEPEVSLTDGLKALKTAHLILQQIEKNIFTSLANPS